MNSGQNQTDALSPDVQRSPLAAMWRRLSGPIKLGLVFAAIGIALTIVGVLRDPTTPDTLWALGVGALISGVTWGVVSWAIGTAAVEVERDLAQGEDEIP